MPHTSIERRFRVVVLFLVCSISSFICQRSFADSTVQVIPAAFIDSATLLTVTAQDTVVRIVDVNVLCEGNGDSASMGDFLEVIVTGLNITRVPHIDSVHARLVLNDLAQELPLLDCLVIGDTAKFVFRLMPETEGAHGWEGFIESIGIKTENVTVGLIVNGKYLGRYNGPLYFHLINSLWAILSGIITLALVALLCWLGGRSMIFTDRIVATTPDSSITVVQRGDYSLSRIQIAFWTVIIVAGFVYIWLSTGYGPEFPQSVLILMGISGATKVITGAMDAKQPIATTSQPTGPKKGIAKVLSDIISDDVSPTISRVQFVIWTLLFGLIFLEHTFEYVKFHDFTTEQLTLMGISNGIYLLMRPNEQ